MENNSQQYKPATVSFNLAFSDKQVAFNKRDA